MIQMAAANRLDKWLAEASSIYGEDGLSKFDVRKAKLLVSELRQSIDSASGFARKLSAAESSIANLNAPGADRVSHLQNDFSSLRRAVEAERDRLKAEGL
ncbi:MAG: hypothetical protein ACRYGP_17430 [Janthinobacterium lividum]